MKESDMAGVKGYGRLTRIMRRALVAVAAAFVVMPLAAQNPGERVSVNGVNSPVRELFRQIEAQTGYTFAVNKSAFDLSRRITVSANRAGLGRVLGEILRDTGFGYFISDNHIIIVPAGELAARRRAVRQYPIPGYEPATVTRPAPVQPAPSEARPQGSTYPIYGPQQPQQQQPVQSQAAPETPKPAPQTKPAPATKAASEPKALKAPREPKDVSTLPGSALKTNLLFDITTTINLGIEARVSPTNTLEMMLYYNAWNFSNNRKWRQILVQPEFRYWFGEPFSGHLLGVHAQWGHYNFTSAPFDKLWGRRRQGDLVGVGVSYGYAWRPGRQKRWSIEATVGLGYNYLDYERFECVKCGNSLGKEHKNYFGPTKAGINLSVMLGGKKE